MIICNNCVFKCIFVFPAHIGLEGYFKCPGPILLSWGTSFYYGMDVSRLLDCCRQDILFTDPKALLACLEAITKDHNVDVVQITNTLNNTLYCKNSCGYRQVNISMIFKFGDSFVLRCTAWNWSWWYLCMAWKICYSHHVPSVWL